VDFFAPLRLCVRRIGYASIEIKIRAHRQQQQRQRERVLQLHDPGDGFDRQGMDDEEEGARPRVPKPQLAETVPDQKRAEHVQRHVHQMVAERVEAPQLPLDPLHAGFQRVVIHGLRRQPDLPEAGRIPQHGILGDLDRIVPIAQEFAVKSRRINEPGRENDGRALQESGHGPLGHKTTQKAQENCSLSSALKVDAASRRVASSGRGKMPRLRSRQVDPK